MNIPLFSDVLNRVARNRIRRIMRGYRFLKKTGQLGLLVAVKDELANARFSKIERKASKLFFGAGIERAELMVRQYLLIRIGGLGLNEALLYSLGAKGSPVVYPMPRLWQNVVASHGFPVARVRSSLAWSGYVLFLWGYGILLIMIQLYGSFRKKPCSRSFRRYVYFMGLIPNNVPRFCKDGSGYDIITWYIRWNGRAKDLDCVYHGVTDAKGCSVDGLPVVFNPDPVPPLNTLKSITRFVGWSILAALFSIFDLLRGHWWHAVLLAESAKGSLTRLQSSDRLARDYLFHQSGCTYRPLWTYEAEKKGARIIFYFYSTNCERFKCADGYSEQMGNWNVMNWPMYLVWDEFQADFVRRAVGAAANIEIVNPIYFVSCSVEMPKIPAGSFAVFDVQPQRDSRYQILGAAEEYYVPRITNQFLLDIHECIRECNGTMVHKRKRHNKRWLHPRYEVLVKRLSGEKDVISVEPDTSAARVTESCLAVISMPFTSTALWGKELGKPSVYYDPFGVVQKDDRAAHGVKVLCGKNELREWLFSTKSSW